jgi:hypothetical protein
VGHFTTMRRRLTLTVCGSILVLMRQPPCGLRLRNCRPNRSPAGGGRTRLSAATTTVTREVGRCWPLPGPSAAFLSGWVRGIWFPVSLAGGSCWSPAGVRGAAWSVALTPRSSGRVRVTPFRRRAQKPGARLPITVAAARCRVTFSFGGAPVLVCPRAAVGSSAGFSGEGGGQRLSARDGITTFRLGQSMHGQGQAHHCTPSIKPNLRPVVANNGQQQPTY